MTHDYDNNGFGGSRHTSNAFEAAKREEAASYQQMNEKVCKSAYDSLMAQNTALTERVSVLEEALCAY